MLNKEAMFRINEAKLYLFMYFKINMWDFWENIKQAISKENIYHIFPRIYNTYGWVCPLWNVIEDLITNWYCREIITTYDWNKQIFKSGNINKDFLNIGINQLWWKNPCINIIDFDYGKWLEYINEYLKEWNTHIQDLDDEHNRFYRISKQLDVMMNYIKLKLETHNPEKLVLKHREIKYPDDISINFLTCLIILEKENYLEVLTFNLSSKSISIFARERKMLSFWSKNNDKKIVSKKWLRISWNKIKNESGDILYYLEGIEETILHLIYSHTNEWWINRENIIQITKQTPNAFTQYLKVFRKKLEEKWLDSNNIAIKFDRKEKTYKCIMS